MIRFAFFNEHDRVMAISAGLFLLCILAAIFFLPENCLFYEHRRVGLLCDTITADPCPVCSNESVATIARVLGAMGIVFLMMPAVIYIIRRWRGRH